MSACSPGFRTDLCQTIYRPRKPVPSFLFFFPSWPHAAILFKFVICLVYTGGPFVISTDSLHTCLFKVDWFSLEKLCKCDRGWFQSAGFIQDRSHNSFVDINCLFRCSRHRSPGVKLAMLTNSPLGVRQWWSLTWVIADYTFLRGQKGHKGCFYLLFIYQGRSISDEMSTCSDDSDGLLRCCEIRDEHLIYGCVRSSLSQRAPLMGLMHHYSLCWGLVALATLA